MAERARKEVPDEPHPFFPEECFPSKREEYLP
jgi:hypothetical protein